MELTAQLGRRTKFQKFDISQLTLLANSSCGQEDLPPSEEPLPEPTQQQLTEWGEDGRPNPDNMPQLGETRTEDDVLLRTVPHDQVSKQKKG